MNDFIRELGKSMELKSISAPSQDGERGTCVSRDVMGAFLNE